MNEDKSLPPENGAAPSQHAQRQVRLQLTTRHADISLPENTGPILVPTGRYLNQPLTWDRSLLTHAIFYFKLCEDTPFQPW